MNALSRRNISLSLSCVLILHAPLFAQTTHYVDSQSTNPVSPYLTPAKAAQTIQAALAVSHNGDTIDVQGGEDRLYHGPISVIVNVIIQPTPPEDAGGGGPPVGGGGRSPCCSVHVQGDGSQPVFRCVGRAAPITLRGLDIFTGGGPQGGGIFVAGCVDILIDCCCVHDNSVSFAGGGILIFLSKRTTIRDCEVFQNQASGPDGAPARGGGLYVQDSPRGSVVLTHFTLNTATKAGGGAYVQNSKEWVFDQCQFEGNHVLPPADAQDGGYGGGMACRGIGATSATTKVSLTLVDFENNTAEPGNGGGLACVGASEATGASPEPDNPQGTEVGLDAGGVDLKMTLGRFTRNETRDGWYVPPPDSSGPIKRRGGGVFLKGLKTSALFEGTRFEDNTAAEDGGGLYVVSRADATLLVSTLIHNAAVDDGGAAEVTGWGKGNFHSCHFVDANTSGQDGGSIHDTTRARVRILGAGTIIADSVAGVNGGAVAVRNAELLIEDGPIHIERNSAGADGGAVHGFITDDSRGIPGAGALFNGDLLVRIRRRVTFERNVCGGFGGAIAMWRKGQEFETSYSFILAIRGQCCFDENVAGTSDENSAIPYGISVRDSYPDGDFECLVSGCRFQNHRSEAAGAPQTAATISFYAAPGGTVERSPLTIRSVFEGGSNFGVVTERADLTIDNSIIANNTRTGLQVSTTEGSGSRSLFSGNGVSDIEAVSGSLFLRECEINGFGATPKGVIVRLAASGTKVYQCNIMQHTLRGVDYGWTSSSDPFVTARLCWWGVPTGPSDPFPGDGTTHTSAGGDVVSLGIDYFRWVTQPFHVLPQVLTGGCE